MTDVDEVGESTAAKRADAVERLRAEVFAVSRNGDERIIVHGERIVLCGECGFSTLPSAFDTRCPKCGGNAEEFRPAMFSNHEMSYILDALVSRCDDESRRAKLLTRSRGADDPLTKDVTDEVRQLELIIAKVRQFVWIPQREPEKKETVSTSSSSPTTDRT